MPIGYPAKDALLGRPYVTMTKSEAVNLSAALGRARQRIVAEIGRVGRSRLPQPEKVAAVHGLRSDLRALQEFHEAHDEAHGLGGF